MMTTVETRSYIESFFSNTQGKITLLNNNIIYVIIKYLYTWPRTFYNRRDENEYYIFNVLNKFKEFYGYTVWTCKLCMVY